MQYFCELSVTSIHFFGRLTCKRDNFCRAGYCFARVRPSQYYLADTRTLRPPKALIDSRSRLFAIIFHIYGKYCPLLIILRIALNSDPITSPSDIFICRLFCITKYVRCVVLYINSLRELNTIPTVLCTDPRSLNSRYGMHVVKSNLNSGVRSSCPDPLVLEGCCVHDSTVTLSLMPPTE